jgi:tripartite-type tricarboxylate transporter receptor subunit TctC
MAAAAARRDRRSRGVGDKAAAAWRHRFWRRIGAVAAAGAAAIVATLVVAAPSAALAEDTGGFYAGKTLKLIVGMPPGGGVDAYARLVQRHLPAHLQGAPSIIVQNVPGAGSLKSVVYLKSLPDDGTTLGTFSSGILTEAITAPERVKIDFRHYAWLGNVSEDVRVCYLWHATGIRTWADLARHGEIMMAASAGGAAGNIDSAVLRDLLGVKLKLIEGYPGSAAKRLAVEKGEVDGDCGGWTSIPEDWLRDAKINVVVRLSATLLPGMDPAVPFAGDLLKNKRDRAVFDFVLAPEKLGRLFMTSGRVPPARVAVLRRAFDTMLADPAFLSDAERLRLTVTPTRGEEVEGAIAALYATPADLVAKATAIAGR